MLLQRNPSSSPKRVRTMSLRKAKRGGGGALSSITSFTGQQDDPLSTMLRPPRNESEEDKQARLASEAEAKKRSEDIDKQLKEEETKLKIKKAQEKTILLLGQAEAGKTTIVKQMRMLYESERQARMRSAWTDVVFLNIILAVKTVVNSYQDALYEAQKGAQRANTSNSSTSSRHQVEAMSPEASKSKALLCRFRLAPLLSLENDLRRTLGTFEETPERKETPKTKQSAFFDGSDLGSSSLLLKAGWQDSLLQAKAEREFLLKCEQDRAVVPRSSMGPTMFGDHTPDKICWPHRMPIADRIAERREYEKPEASIDQNDMQCLLEACIPDIEDLMRSMHDLRPQGCIPGLSRNDSATYFLDNLFRFSSPGYTPTDDDILRARVRTVGVYEERFAVNKHLTYRIVDVGGSISQRNVWAQFFSEATAIIFLAPISAFDEYLTEDPRKNKIKDSLELWEAITSSSLLHRVSLVLFLNKIDILKAKLHAGTMVKQYFTKYSGANSFDEVWRYFRSLFVAIASKHQNAAPSRNLYIDKTTATSTREIQVILTSCQDIILRQNLKEASLT